MGWKALVAEKIDKKGLAILRDAADAVEVRLGLSPAELVAVVGEFDALVVRSATKVTGEAIEHGAQGRLRIVARAGVGVDNVDVSAATRCGVVVVNSPSGNTVAAAEHALALLLALARNIPEACQQAKQSAASAWMRRSAFVGVQMEGKTLGIVGFGRVGQHVSRCAHGLGMRVLAHDPFLPADRVAAGGADESVALEDLLRRSDFVSVHVPLTKETRGMLDARRLALLQPHAFLVNAARGGIVDEDALVASLRSGRIAGAALDVLSTEPPAPDSPVALAAKELGARLVLTPHLGASTVEAQQGVAVDVAQQIVEFLAVENAPIPRGAVNIPADLRAPGAAQASVPWIALADVLAQFAGQLLDDQRVCKLSVRVFGEARVTPTVAAAAACTGLLSVAKGAVGRVSIINATTVAESRGVAVSAASVASAGEKGRSISVEVEAESGERHILSGTSGSNGGMMLLESVDGFRVQVPFSRLLVVISHFDTPGVIGSVGSVLGRAGCNVARMVVGRALGEKALPGSAMMVLTVDQPLGSAGLATLSRQQNVRSAKFIELHGSFPESLPLRPKL